MAAHVDPKLLEDLRCVKESLELFHRAGDPREFWEAFCVQKGLREAFAEEVRRLRDAKAQDGPAAIGPQVLEKLTGVRRRLGPLVQDLRHFWALVPGAPRDERLEMLLGFLMISPKALELMSRWLFDPPAFVGEGEQKLQGLLALIEAYQAALAPAQEESPPEPAPDPEPEPAPASEPPPPDPAPLSYSSPIAPETKAQPPRPAGVDTRIMRSKSVDPEILGVLRLAGECRRILEAERGEVELWELFALMRTQKEAMQDLLNVKREGNAEAAQQAAGTLYGNVQAARSEHGKFVEDLRVFVESLQIGSFGKDIMDMTIAFIVGAPRARAHAADWLADPERFKGQASGRVEFVIRQALTYRNALLEPSGASSA